MHSKTSSLLRLWCAPPSKICQGWPKESAFLSTSFKSMSKTTQPFIPDWVIFSTTQLWSRVLLIHSDLISKFSLKKQWCNAMYCTVQASLSPALLKQLLLYEEDIDFNDPKLLLYIDKTLAGKATIILSKRLRRPILKFGHHIHCTNIQRNIINYRNAGGNSPFHHFQCYHWMPCSSIQVQTSRMGQKFLDLVLQHVPTSLHQLIIRQILNSKSSGLKR